MQLPSDQDGTNIPRGITHIFAGNPLNRGERERRDEQWIAEKTKDPASKFMPMADLNILISEEADRRLRWLSTEEKVNLGIDGGAYFLGAFEDAAHFVVDVSKKEDVIGELSGDGAWKFEDARSAAESLSPSEAGIAAHARSQVNWHTQHRFCSVCGAETIVERGGGVRRCSKCKAEHFPRTDPVIIVVVHDGDRCLLGQSRNRMARANRYSALAGFLDQGESIEEAVAREVMEEAGIKIKNIRYHSSQPWPFPSSLMIGCHAEAATTEIAMDEEEMADVRWFPRDEVLLALEERSSVLMVPGPIAIAHHLLKAWATATIDLP